MVERPEYKVFLLLCEEVTRHTSDDVVQERLQTEFDQIHRSSLVRGESTCVVETAGDGGELECDGRVEWELSDEELLHKRDIERPVIAVEIHESNNGAEFGIEERDILCGPGVKERSGWNDILLDEIGFAGVGGGWIVGRGISG